MNQRQEIGFQLPPPYPYAGDPPSYPNSALSSVIGSNVPSSTLNLFNETLRNNDTFILAPMGSFGLTARTIVVQLQNTAQQPIMSIMTVPGQNISTGDNNNYSIRIGSVMQMSNTSGQVLLTAREVGQSMTISSGEQVLGLVEGNRLCSSTLTATGVMGEMLFQSVGGTEMNPSSSGGCCCSYPSEFTLMSNGVTLARIEKPMNGSQGYSITLLNSRNIDLRTKALLIFSGYLLYYSYLAKTALGNVGARGYFKRIWMFIYIFFAIAMILMISIPMTLTP